MINSNDIVFVFSGGQGNFDPFKSLGGDPSVVEISEVSQGLFGSLSDQELKAGLIDYRCLYIFNQSDTETLYDFSIYVQNSTTIECLIGLKKQNDIQKITLSGAPNSGSITFDYNTEQFTVEFSPEPNQFAINFQEQLVDLGLLGTIVTVEAKTEYYVVNITFSGDSGYKYHPLLKLVDNNLTPSTNFFIEKLQEGSPINLVLPKTPNLITAPENLEFYLATATNPINLASLKPNEGVPVWLKRTVPAGSTKTENLNFDFKIKGRIIS